jgi:hypothetical protein
LSSTSCVERRLHRGFIELHRHRRFHHADRFAQRADLEPGPGADEVEKGYEPWSLVCFDYFDAGIDVARSIALAPATTLPLESVTVPRTLPRNSWATSAELERKRNAVATRKFMMLPLTWSANSEGKHITN